MPITFQTISSSDVTTLKARADVLTKGMSDRRLMACLVYLLWSMYGDQGSDIDATTLIANTNIIEQQMNDRELRAAMIYALWSSTGA